MKPFLLLLSLIIFSNIYGQQKTYVPDNNFEGYLISEGYDDVLDDSVTTANISAVPSLELGQLFISDLTGIKDFTALTFLECYNNQLTSLNLSQNINLIILRCNENQIMSLDLSQNINLNELDCAYNQLTGLNLSQNIDLKFLYCEYNQLTCLNIANGNNTHPDFYINTTDNANLTCIEVDDAAWSMANWLDIDAQTSFSTNCNNSCSWAVDINENNLSSTSIYPNPSNTGLMQLNTSIANSDISIYSIEGKQINFTQSNNVIDISDNEKGVYLVSIDGVVIRYVYQE